LEEEREAMKLLFKCSKKTRIQAEDLVAGPEEILDDATTLLGELMQHARRKIRFNINLKCW
jgi:hypothetical protein